MEDRPILMVSFQKLLFNIMLWFRLLLGNNGLTFLVKMPCSVLFRLARAW